MTTSEHTDGGQVPDRTAADQLREQVRDRYASAARYAAAGARAGDCGCGQPADCGCATFCCGPPAPTGAPGFGAALYTPGEHGELPEAALLASLGCGNPTAVAELHQGETVLDLGSAVASTSCSAPNGSAPPARPTAST
jgi:arsenite methyltransferase